MSTITINQSNFGLISSIIYEHLRHGVEFTVTSSQPLQINRDEEIVDAVVNNQQELSQYLNSIK